MLTLQHEEKQLKEDEKVLNAEIKQLKDDMNNFEMNFKSGQNKYKGK
jgi:cell division protein FtsB